MCASACHDLATCRKYPDLMGVRPLDDWLLTVRQAGSAKQAEKPAPKEKEEAQPKSEEPPKQEESRKPISADEKPQPQPEKASPPKSQPGPPPPEPGQKASAAHCVGFGERMLRRFGTLKDDATSSPYLWTLPSVAVE